MPEVGPIPQPSQTLSRSDRALHEAAQKMEASFLAEMLKSAGLGKTRDAFGGGSGEDQFSSFLLREQAMMLVKTGGIGLTEALFESLKEKHNG